MSNMISVASGFQYSVNIAFDLGNDEKLKNFIPTRSSLSLLEEVLLSTAKTSTERSRILIGAYGKGKSHIVLTILSILMKRDLKLFEKMLPKLEENPRIKQCVLNYYDSDNRILPVVISGSNTSLPQAFLLALQRTLSDNDLLDIMPETNYKAAISVIERWQNEFPETFSAFQLAIGVPVTKFVDRLSSYDITAYEEFERIYPTLTAGSVFNPFLGFDVVELYESVAVSLKQKGYTGIYVVYDEFSKYLEANITEASVSDTKMLQDFAEKCNRSGETQLHLMLISHKEIANYIDKLPKQKVDGWRGVSERFKHIHLNNNFSQTYEIISSVIQKEPILWNQFQIDHKSDFEDITRRYISHPLFSENKDELKTALYGCYPLHPVSTFILPRLSERIAQNERTLFTFLSASGYSTLPSYLERSNDAFAFVTPDVIFDYFEPLFKKEVYAGEIHENYVLTANILSRIEFDSLEAKIVKTISLFYTLGQFERLKPTKDEIVGVFSSAYAASEITTAIDNLIERDFVIYLKRSNNFLKLKQTSGIDIKQKISDYAEFHSKKVSVKEILNASNFDNYMYPSRYNDDREMTRFFAFMFIDESEVRADTDWDIKSESIEADGIIYAIIPHSEESISQLKETILETSKGCKSQIFIIPNHYTNIDDIAHEYEAVTFLRAEAIDDPVLLDEYDVVYEDLREVISDFISIYAQPEKFKASYIFDGEQKNVCRKAALTELMSDICDQVFSRTPVISNEAVNRNVITSIASNSRNKIIAALLRNQLEPNLGLSGTGQDVSIMRSTLLRTGVFSSQDGLPSLNLRPDDSNIANMLETIEDFVLSAKRNERIGFDVLYGILTLPEYHIGLRKGLIPIYLAVVLHEYKQQVIILDRFGQVPISADALLQINANPSAFSLSYLDWDSEKESFIEQLSAVYFEYIIEAEKGANAYDFVVNAMKRWAMSLSKYAKEIKIQPNGKKIDNRHLSLLKLLKQNTSSYELLFEKLPKAYGYADKFSAGLVDNISVSKSYFDGLVDDLKMVLISETKRIFMLPQNDAFVSKMSLTSTIKEWCDSVSPSAFSHIFPDGTDKCLSLFKTVTNDENAFIVRLAKTATGLRVEDWDDGTVEAFKNRLIQYKETAESYHEEVYNEQSDCTSNYRVTFVEPDGTSTTKSFERVAYSNRGKLLFNQITQSLDSMGHAITEQEKRQIIMEILEKLC
ncbi:MAG: restriction endonuclease subunit S [Ruminococcus sp.]|nr:restriction endonuclease subunit S [Ruminococcus sp.]